MYSVTGALRSASSGHGDALLLFLLTFGFLESADTWVDFLTLLDGLKNEVSSKRHWANEKKSHKQTTIVKV